MIDLISVRHSKQLVLGPRVFLRMLILPRGILHPAPRLGRHPVEEIQRFYIFFANMLNHGQRGI